MGKPTGFMEYDRCEAASVEPKERIKNFNEFHVFLSKENQQKQAARCMDCGVPFCQSGMTIAGMTSGCPLHNLVPEWNDLVYTGNWEQAYNRLHKTNNFPEFTSRVCPALCEKACTCGHWGSPVSVRDNEHGVIETAYATDMQLQSHQRSEPARRWQSLVRALQDLRQQTSLIREAMRLQYMRERTASVACSCMVFQI